MRHRSPRTSDARLGPSSHPGSKNACIGRAHTAGGGLPGSNPCSWQRGPGVCRIDVHFFFQQVGLQFDLMFRHCSGCVATHEVSKCHVRAVGPEANLGQAHDANGPLPGPLPERMHCQVTKGLAGSDDAVCDDVTHAGDAGVDVG